MIKCQHCGKFINTGPGEKCPECGEMGRVIYEKLSDTVGMSDIVTRRMKKFWGHHT